jgi:hypothetical protein
MAMCVCSDWGALTVMTTWSSLLGAVSALLITDKLIRCEYSGTGFLLVPFILPVCD